MKKSIVILVVVIITAVLAAVVWKREKAAGAKDATAQTPATVQRGVIRQSVQCTGRVVSNLDVEIKCKASGQVVKLPFDISDPVKKGDLIAEIDPIDQVRLVEQAKAALAGSQARLDQAIANLAVAEETIKVDKIRTDAALKAAEAHVADASAKAKREKDLLAKKQASNEEAETAETAAIQAAADLAKAQADIAAIKVQELQLNVRREDIKLNQAEVDSDKVALEIANQRLSETKLMAPIDGVVAARTVQIGQIIASGVSNVGGGTTVLTLSDLSHIFVYASVDESDIGNVVVDQPVRITADSYPRKKFMGKVVRIATKGVNVSNVITFEVRVEVTSENKTLLKPEMTGNVEIIVAEKEDVLTAPVTAIARKTDQSYVVRKKDDGTTEEVTVEVGISDGANTEIVSGVQENDEVILQKSQLDSRWRADAQKMRMNTGGAAMMRGMGGPRR